MSVESIIDELKCDVQSIFIVEHREVCDNALRAKNIFFLDTCFVSRTAQFLDASKVCMTFERMSGGRENVVFAVTEMVLYELKASSENRIQTKARSFFEALHSYGYTILLISEQELRYQVGRYLDLKSTEWNRNFAETLHDNVAFLRKICGIIKSDNQFPYKNMLEQSYNVPRSSEFISNIIKYIKDRKSTKDSLAEELIFICIYFIGVIAHNTGFNRILFCSDDWPAITMMKKAIRNVFGTESMKYESIHLFSFIQYMILEGIITEKEEISESLKKIVGDSITIVESKDSPFLSDERTVSTEEALDMILEGKKIAIKGKG